MNKFLRKLLLAGLFFAGCLSSNATDVLEHDKQMRIAVSNLDNKSNVSITLYLSAPGTPVTAFEARIQLPDGAVFNAADGCNTVVSNVSDSHILTEGTPAGSTVLYASVASPTLAAIDAPADTPVATWNCDLSSLGDGEHTIRALGLLAVSVEDGEVKSYPIPSQEYTFRITDDIITGIEEITPVGAPRTPVIYNLLGVKVKSPVPGGIYIIDGKKTFVK